MQKFNLSRKLFEVEERSSEDSDNSVIYISIDEEEDALDSWNSDWSTDTEAIISRIERELKSRPIAIGDRAMTTEGHDDEMEAGPSNPLPTPPSTPKLGFQYFDKKLCYAPPSKLEKAKIELCNTILPVLDVSFVAP